MADIGARLKTLRDGLGGLREQLASADQPAAVERIAALIAELEGIIRDAEAARESSARPVRARVKPTGAERCPLCTIRSLHMLPEATRPARGEAGDEEVLWRCLSCGHEVWRSSD
jgi:uncharacterized protein with PIN domain